MARVLGACVKMCTLKVLLTLRAPVAPTKS